MNRLIVTAGTTCGVSDNAMMSDAMQDAFTYAIANARQLAGYKIPKRAKYSAVQQSEFGHFVSQVTGLVVDVSAAWKGFLGIVPPFISVASDAWDGKNKEIFGLSVFILHPRTFEFSPLALALLKLGTSKIATELSSQGLKGLERYKISRDLLYGTVTDNENTAAKAGKLMGAYLSTLFLFICIYLYLFVYIVIHLYTYVCIGMHLYTFGSLTH